MELQIPKKLYILVYSSPSNYLTLACIRLHRYYNLQATASCIYNMYYNLQATASFIYNMDRKHLPNSGQFIQTHRLLTTASGWFFISSSLHFHSSDALERIAILIECRKWKWSNNRIKRPWSCSVYVLHLILTLLMQNRTQTKCQQLVTTCL